MIEFFIWLTLNTYFEARNQSLAGQIAVNQVVINRCMQRRQNVIDVITAEKQFSWFNGKVVPAIREPRELFPCAVAVWKTFMNRLSGDTLDGANLYFNHNLVSPSWASTAKHIAVIEDHTFLRE